MVAAGDTGLVVEQTDRYVDGDGSYRTDLVVRNTTGTSHDFTIWRGGDCQRADSDTGFGRLEAGSGLVGCVGADGRALDWMPLTPGSSAFEGDPIDLWAEIASQATFPDTCRCSEDIDNAAGISWSGVIESGASVTFSHLTVFSPDGLVPVGLGLDLDRVSIGRGGELRFTVSLDNTANDRPVALTSLEVQLPDGFSYVAATTIGAPEPVVVGGHLLWPSPIVLASSSTASVEFTVIAGPLPGVFTSLVDATSADAAVMGGAGVDVVVEPGLAPFPSFADVPTGLAVDLDGSDSFDDGTIVLYSWDFGDGADGTGDTISHVYSAAGIYDVVLSVTDDDGLTRSRTRAVTVLDPNLGPTAVGSATPLNPIEVSDGPSGFRAAQQVPGALFTGLAFSFDGSGSFDLDGTIIGWRWDFGDGSAGSGRLVEHVYAGAGEFEVTLVVTDDRGDTDSADVPGRRDDADQHPAAGRLPVRRRQPRRRLRCDRQYRCRRALRQAGDLGMGVR